MKPERPFETDGRASLKQLLWPLLVTCISLGMVLGGVLLSQLETPEGALPSPPSVAQRATVTPFLPTLTPRPSPTPTSTAAEPGRVPDEESPDDPTTEPTSPPSIVATPTPAPTDPPSPPAVCTTPAGWTSYTVRSGDTLTSLARRAGVTTWELMRGNCRSTPALRSGETIYVPPTFSVEPVPEPLPCTVPAGWVSYNVQPNDTLYSLARRFNVELETLQRANCLPGHAINVGDTLYVPPGVLTPAPRDYPAPVLLSPEDGAQFPVGREIPVRWMWDGELGEDEHFDVRLWREGAPHYGVGWSREESYAVKGDPGVLYYWSIAVIRGKDGRMLEQLSPESPPRRIWWGTLE